MFASMCRKLPAPRAMMAGCVLMMLAACEHYAPNVRPERDSTEAITRAQAERLQERSATRTMPPSQIRIPTGFAAADESPVCRDWLDPCWERGAGSTAAADPNVPSLARAPRPADAQTFRGMLACTDAALGCTAQHATLTLYANQTWRARISYQDRAGQAGEPTRLSGCWQRGANEPRRIVLYLANGNPMGEFVASSANTLELVAPEDAPTSLRYTLTRQPDAETFGMSRPERSECVGG